MNGQALRVWLIDDDASIRWVLERALRNGGQTGRYQHERCDDQQQGGNYGNHSASHERD